MRILITGINGFIGQRLASELTSKGHFIIGVGRSTKCKATNIQAYYCGSVTDKKLVKKVIAGTDAVIHLAAKTAHKDIAEKRTETLEINFFGTKNILDAFSKSKTAKKFLYASSGKVYGKIISLPITEAHPTNPLNILGKSKLEVEKLIKSYDKSKKEFTIFRIFNVYGSGQNENFLIPTILKQLSNGKKEIALGDISAKRDYIYIDDLVNAFVLAIESRKSTDVSIYNICTGIGSSASKIVNIISKIKGIKIKIKVNPNLIRTDESREEYGSFELTKRQLGWEPKINLEEGLRKLCKQ